MKQILMDMMVMMMPFMMPIVKAGYAAVAVGVLGAVAGLFVPSLSRWGLLAARVTAGIGIFFLACEVMGFLLGANPGINLGDATKFEFNIKPFWYFGAAFLLAGIIIGYFTGRQTAQHA
jgi:hypothetical protein